LRLTTFMAIHPIEMGLAVLCLSTHEVFIHIFGDNCIMHNCVTGTSVLLGTMAKIHLDWLQLSVCLQTDDIKKLQNYVVTRQCSTPLYLWSMWFGLLLEHSLTWPNILLTRFRYHQKAPTGLLMSISCHMFTHLCWSVDIHLKALLLLKPTQSHWAVTQWFIAIFYVAVGSSSTDVVPHTHFPCTN
jgi:hypothetical protein